MIIYKLGLKEPALLQELAASIEIIMAESEISMKTCGRKMLRKISRQYRRQKCSKTVTDQ